MDKMQILAIIFGSLWTFFRASSWIWFKKSADLDRLYDALEVGVSRAWESIVKPYLAKNDPTAPLPESVRAAAERAAITTAVATDKIVNKFPIEVVRATLKAAVEDAKRRGGK